jgi:hypothetical protein
MMLRCGAASIGVLAGFVIGFMLAILFAATGTLPSVPFGAWVFGIPAALAILCFVHPPVAFLLFPGLAHFFAGAAYGVVLDEDMEISTHERKGSAFLRIAFYIGLAVAVLGLAAFHYR